ncbi:MAG: methyltransferase type 12 [Candidatus Moranbacteria bacterium RIFOXYB1_FULL_43_19]|nr:MAG: methyltransferase type 12 [Candidatus Moranbacteria bacterium RIFOXYB1_FULL_43_19]OGI33017.1 MAG: methyltransferase type 12 [Candidatus Moranbacteria bacterium RIFOXYC1_FULL_44_13]OGI38430.1 MAG: methyltransferase type 12 [Candidatus Moranbacteria bacterium RIFOXYD1_FULL_44_12]
MKSRDLAYSKEEEQYSDGSIENDILSTLKSDNFEDKIEKILRDDPNWPMRYHFSRVRENILSWYDFGENKTLLEVGAGCGALTGLFCDRLKRVAAVELTKIRSDIIYNRHKNRKNLDVITGNLNDLKNEEKFDYVTLIGVLEYAGKYTKSSNPFTDFLKKARSFLKENGILILAIENKFGLKYWAGAKEDHTGKIFDSIENYPDGKGIQTFGKEEIKNIFTEAGFEKLDFYYPMPDYKLPIEIFSDEYLPTQKHNIRSDVFPFVDLSQSREFLFNEKLALDNIINNKCFDLFANSFLIFAKK